jgi:hypothetical protein
MPRDRGVSRGLRALAERDVHFDYRATFGAARNVEFSVQSAHALPHAGDAVRE